MKSVVNTKYQLGIDIGGTFTDIALIDGLTGRVAMGKILTTPSNPVEAVIKGVNNLLAEHGVVPGEVEAVIHATTLVTNAVIERKGARTALLVTEGFRDVLRIGRELRYDLYDLGLALPELLVDWRNTFEVRERLGALGEVVVPLDRAQILEIAARLRSEGIQAVAVSLLHSYTDSSHENAVAEELASSSPQLFTSTSSSTCPEIREYERTTTTVVNAYVQPIAEKYLHELARRLGAMELPDQPYIMLSSGGITSVEEAARCPYKMIESGPAAGVLAATFYGGCSGYDNLLSFDMGGTTAKICLIDRGSPNVGHGFEVARVHRFKKGSGLPVRVPSIELIEIGAGGGSIARPGELGVLKVGPDSTGADPGPACYGGGGVEPTVTDADLVLGYLNPEYFLGGRMALDRQAAEKALAERVARPLDLGLEQAAWGVHEIVNESMARAAQVHIAERGSDPRSYTLVAFGGAGPVHAFRVAGKLGIRRMIFPVGAGVASAIGLLVAPCRVDLVRTYLTGLDQADWARVEAYYASMEDEAKSILEVMRADSDTVSFVRQAEMRYRGQGYEITVSLPGGAIEPDAIQEIVENFKETYARLYGRQLSGGVIEAVNWRLVGLQERRLAGTGLRPANGTAAADPVKGSRSVYLPEAGGYQEVTVYDRYALTEGKSYSGPAIVEEKESTVVIGPGAVFYCDASGNLLMDLEGDNK